MSDVARSDRLRLDKLLKGLTERQEASLDVDAELEWVAGFEDPERPIEVTVAWIADPQVRDHCAAALRKKVTSDCQSRVATNGGMLFYAIGPDDEDSEDRLDVLVSRFSGRE